MFFTACAPSRALSCARYKLSGCTGFPADSMMAGSSGERGGPPSKMGNGGLTSSPRLPIDQIIEPGGVFMANDCADEFQTTAQPIAQPCPDPISPRFIKSMPPPGT